MNIFNSPRLRERRQGYELLNELLKDKGKCYIIHYSCESFITSHGRTPRVTSICVRNLKTAQTRSFSIHLKAQTMGLDFNNLSVKDYDVIEKEMLNDFTVFVRQYPSFKWIHWNMRDSNYGAKEIDLQISMINSFAASNRASRYTAEVVEAADGGRVDILFSGENLQLPLELKRSTRNLTWDNISQDYISQAQTYSHTRDQLAFFIVLDLSEKQGPKPSPNIRDLFKVIHLETNHSLDIKFPDYVVCFIVEGNKLSPHKRSKY